MSAVSPLPSEAFVRALTIATITAVVLNGRSGRTSGQTVEYSNTELEFRRPDHQTCFQQIAVCKSVDLCGIVGGWDIKRRTLPLLDSLHRDMISDRPIAAHLSPECLRPEHFKWRSGCKAHGACTAAVLIEIYIVYRRNNQYTPALLPSSNLMQKRPNPDTLPRASVVLLPGRNTGWLEDPA